jgi:hypothetical protein
MRLLSSKVSRSVSGLALMTKLELALASLVLIAKCIHLWSHMAWISPFACLFRLFLELLTDLRPLTQQLAFPSCFAPSLQWSYGMRLALHAAAGAFRGNQAASPRLFGWKYWTYCVMPFPLSCHLYNSPFSFPSLREKRTWPLVSHQTSINVQPPFNSRKDRKGYPV